tara:strand:- start:162 stop:932 length:771 start_codon:yes stop_codon:yes gene_type:complete
MNSILKTYKTIYKQIENRLSGNFNFIIPLISGFLLMLIVRSFLAILDTIFIQEEFPFQRIIFIFSTGLLITGVEIGYTKLIFEKIDNQNRNISFIFNNFNLLGKYLIGLILFYFIVFLTFIPGIIYIFIKYGIDFFDVLGNAILDPFFQELASSYFNLTELSFIIILFSIPTIYITLRLFFWSYWIIDKNLSGLEAIKRSWHITNNKTTEIVIFSLGLLFFNFLGALLIIGICITIPISYLFICLYFRFLISNNHK